MGIRNGRREDIPAVVDIFRRVFPDSVAPERLAPYIERMLFDGPWVEDDMPSLAFENKDGELEGFLGVVPHRLRMGDRELRVAVSSYLMVAPEARASLAGVMLLRKLFAGPQDLTVAEGNDASRKLWDRLGGKTSILYSTHWASPLRPSRYAVDQVGSSKLLAPLRWLAGLPDWVATTVERSPFHRPAPDVQTEELTPKNFIEAIAALAPEYKITPSYDEQSAAWMLEHLARRTAMGALQKTLIRSKDGSILGWTIWYALPNDTCHVAAVVARRGAETDVVGHLFRAATQAGGTVLAGRLEPRLMRELGANVALISRSHTWMMIHSGDDEVLTTIQDGDALMTRLEGEWWVPYREA